MPLLELDVLKAAQGLRYNYIKSAKFSKTNKLLRKSGFKHVLCADNVTDKQLKVFYSSNPIENSRLGIIASKKNFSKAVDRNHIKRIIREVFRHHTIKACCLDLVVLVKNTYSDNNKINNSSLEVLFSRIENKCADL